MVTAASAVAYRRVETGWPMLLATLAVTSGTLVLWAIGLVKASPSGRPSLLVPVVLTLVEALAIVLSTLRIEIADGELRYGFLGQLFGGRVPVREIREASVTEFSWLAGWGIRRVSGGWLYRVRGTSAVAITRADGRRLFLGTQDAEGLRRALLAARLAAR